MLFWDISLQQFSSYLLVYSAAILKIFNQIQRNFVYFNQLYLLCLIMVYHNHTNILGVFGDKINKNYYLDGRINFQWLQYPYNLNKCSINFYCKCLFKQQWCFLRYKQHIHWNDHKFKLVLLKLYHNLPQGITQYCVVNQLMFQFNFFFLKRQTITVLLMLHNYEI